MYSRHYFLIIVVLFSSCIRIAINENGYRQLSNAERAAIKTFSVENVKKSEDQCLFIEITGNDVRKIFDNYPYTWAYYWVPYCTDSTCRPLYYYDRIAKAHEQDGMRFLLISQDFNLKLINRHIRQADFKRAVFFPKDSLYGHKIYRTRRQFAEELIRDKALSKKTPTHMIFKGDTLIYYSADISLAVMDSVIQNN